MEKKNYRLTLLLVGVCVCFLTSCEQALTSMNDDAPAPGPVSNVIVENIQGGAMLTYDLPAGKNVWYVKAEYEIRPGVRRVKKSSYYTNQMLLDGFGSSKPYEVLLYAYGKNDKASAPITVQVHPEISPVQSAYNSLSMDEDFSGLRVKMENSTGADIALYVITKDSLGYWMPVETFYTNQRNGAFTVRGFAATPRHFGVYLRDRWENYSDTLIRELTPYFEEELDKGKFAEIRLPTDTWQCRYGGVGVYSIWNGNRARSGQSHNFQSILPSPIPQWFTFDLGVTAKLSRLQYWQKDGLFAGGNAKTIEIWGSNNPNPDGSWESWTLLATFQSFKPSGLPVSQGRTDEDTAHGIAGDDFPFPLDAPAVRYIRWKTLETWDPTAQNVWVNEISVWGEVQ